MIKAEKATHWSGPYLLADVEVKLADAIEGQSQASVIRVVSNYDLERLRERIAEWDEDYYLLVCKPPRQQEIFRRVSIETHDALEARSEAAPTLIEEPNVGEGLWLYTGSFYRADPDLTEGDVLALVTEKENRKRLKLEKAHALLAMTEQLDSRAKRQPISQDVKVLVWQRDKGRCVECGSQQELEYDHIIPLAMGGSNTDRNLQMLCAVCNRRKGATLG